MKIQKILNIICSALFLFVSLAAILESVFQIETKFYDATNRALILPWDLTGPLAEKRLLLVLYTLLVGCLISANYDIKCLKQSRSVAQVINAITSIGSVIIFASLMCEMAELYDVPSVQVGKKGITLSLPIAKGSALSTLLILNTMLVFSVTSIIQDIKALRGA